MCRRARRSAAWSRSGCRRVRGLDDAALLALSKARLLSLDLAEMRTIQRYYADLDRDPTDVELETLAQTWSEHCVHKTFKAQIDFTHRNADGDGA
jgi:phosphoribosylformylglycinamidine (FGAM) synthase-like enzyme